MSFEVARAVTLVSMFTISIAAPGTTKPLLSVTRPRTVPRDSCDRPTSGIRQIKAKALQKANKRFNMATSIWRIYISSRRGSKHAEAAYLQALYTSPKRKTAERLTLQRGTGSAVVCLY